MNAFTREKVSNKRMKILHGYFIAYHETDVEEITIGKHIEIP